MSRQAQQNPPRNTAPLPSATLFFCYVKLIVIKPLKNRIERTLIKTMVYFSPIKKSAEQSEGCEKVPLMFFFSLQREHIMYSSWQG